MRRTANAGCGEVDGRAIVEGQSRRNYQICPYQKRAMNSPESVGISGCRRRVPKEEIHKQGDNNNGTQLAARSYEPCMQQAQHRHTLQGTAAFSLTCCNKAISPFRISIGDGGQPRTWRSTGTTFETPPTTA